MHDLERPDRLTYDLALERILARFWRVERALHRKLQRLVTNAMSCQRNNRVQVSISDTLQDIVESNDSMLCLGSWAIDSL